MVCLVEWVAWVEWVEWECNPKNLSKKYGGQFHFDIIGLAKKKILAMDGFGGQQVIVDFDSGRIIVVHSLDRHYNWKKIVHKKLKQK